MFDPEDPLLLRVREIALDLPGAAEKISHGHPAFFTKKVFAYFGGSVKVDGAWAPHEHSLVVLPDEEEARALLEEPRCYRPAYLGPSGWVGVDLDEGTDWLEVAELVESSYRRTAGTLDIARLDAR
jgi:predicted DNA-binding protein (MmcQ/YjbR family)